MRPPASIVTVGTELVEGLRLDTNTREIAQSLARHGYRVVEAVTVGDDVAVLAEVLRRLSARDELVLVTGGLGPTHDDVTRAAASEALGLRLTRDPGLEADLEPMLARHRSPEAAASVLGQADVLLGARVLLPTTGTAPGQLVRGLSGGWVALLPGPPAEMRPMLSQLLELVGATDSDAQAAPRELGFVGLSESDAQLAAQRVLAHYPGIVLTLLARPGDVRVVLFDEGAGADALDAAADTIAAELEDACYSLTGETLAQVVLSAAQARAITLAAAESCTGGMVAAAITDVPGASDAFRGGVVAYSNDAKKALLGVSEATLARHGAVSAECASEMATGARARLSADLAVAVTGIAGPEGGSAEKPVGLVWFAVATPTSLRTERRILPGDRAGVRVRATAVALDLLRRAVLSE